MSGAGTPDPGSGASTEVNPVFALVAAPMLKSTKLQDRLAHLEAFELYEKQINAQIAAGAKLKATSFKETISIRDLETICLFELDALKPEDATAEDLKQNFERLRFLDVDALSSVDIGKILGNVKMDATEDIATRVSTFFGEVNACLKDNRCVELLNHKSSMKELTKEIIKRLEPIRLRNAAQKSYDFKSDKPKTLRELMKMIQEVAIVIERAYKLGLSVTKESATDRNDKRETPKPNHAAKQTAFGQKRFSKPPTYATAVTTPVVKPTQAPTNAKPQTPKKEGTKICYRCGKPGHISTDCKASDAEAEAYQKNRRFTRSMAGPKGMMSAAIEGLDSFVLHGVLNGSVVVSVKPDTGSTRSYASRSVMDKLKAAGTIRDVIEVKKQVVHLADEKAAVNVLAKTNVDLEMTTANGPLILKGIELFFLDMETKTILLGLSDLKSLGIDMEAMLDAAAKEQKGRRERSSSA